MYLTKNALFSLVCLFIFLLPINNALAQKNKTLVLNSTTQTPLSSPDQTGFFDQIALEAFSRIGMTLETVHIPAERSLLDSNNGILDGELTRVKGMEEHYTNLIPAQEKLIDQIIFNKILLPLEKSL